jgi:hypothetical protein
MKRLFLIAGLMTAFVLALVAVSASGGVNFGGTWALDKAKSQGLSQRMQNAESVTCIIIQDDKTISMEWKITGGQPPAGAPPAGGPPAGGAPSGGGGGAGRGPSGPQVYNLDGKEVTSEGQMGGTNTMKATWSTDAKTLELTTVRAGNRDGQEFKFTTTDKLSLSEDGKVLTVNRHSESPRGPQDSTFVFNKQ